MKPEQTKQLKPGDTIFIRAKFIKAGDWGNIVFSCQHRDDGIVELPHYSMMETVFSLSDLQPPEEKTKYDPCRLFKKGDKVRLVTCNGRPPYNYVNEDEYVPDETIFSVMNDEETCGYVDLYEKSTADGFQIHHSNLELVTPVEATEPFSVEQNRHGWIVCKDYPGNAVANFNYTHPNARAAAETERDRLNAEYKKAREKAVNEPNLSC